MSKDWDQYLTKVDEKTAAISVNMSMAEAVPMRSLPYMGFVRIFLCCQDETGFAVPHEYETLTVLEEAIVGTLTLGGKAVYVGRCVTCGKVELIFYTAHQEGWREKTALVMRAYPAYQWEAGILPDPDWVVYEDFLFPDEKDMQSIRHRRGWRQWQKRKGGLLRPALMEHWFGFARDCDRSAFCDEAKAWGFTVEEFVASPATALSLPPRESASRPKPEERHPRAEGQPQPPAPQCGRKRVEQDHCEIPPRSLLYDPAPERQERTPMFTPPSRHIAYRVRLSRVDPLEAMDQVSEELAELAERYFGEYNGWGWRLIP